MTPQACLATALRRRLSLAPARAFSPLMACAGLLGALALLPGAARAHADHAHHAAAPAGLKRSEMAPLVLPAVQVLRQDGTRTDLRKLLDDGRPVMLNFIYTSCTAICPVTEQVFREARERLGRSRDTLHLVSISIDPEYDTPARMAEYARRFTDDDKWSFLTTGREDSVAIQKAFKAYQGDKMNHVPVTFLRAAGAQKPWVRLDGFASPAVLVTEVQSLLAPGKGLAVSSTAPVQAKSGH